MYRVWISHVQGIMLEPPGIYWGVLGVLWGTVSTIYYRYITCSTLKISIQDTGIW